MAAPDQSSGVKWWSVMVLAAGVAGTVALGGRQEVRKGKPARECTAGLSRVVRARILLKESIVQRLVEGKTTLREAAGFFRSLNQVYPPCVWDPLCQKGEQGNSEEETYCRDVIYWMKGYVLRTDPCLGERLVAELTEELNEQLQQGTLTLPTASTSLLAEFEQMQRCPPEQGEPQG